MRWLWLKIDFTILFHSKIVRYLFFSCSLFSAEFFVCLCAFLVTLFLPQAHTHAYTLHTKMSRNFRGPELHHFVSEGQEDGEVPQNFCFLLYLCFHLAISCPRQESHRAVFLCSQWLLPQKTLVLQQRAGDENCFSDPHSVSRVSLSRSQGLTPTDTFWWVYFL